MKGGKILNLGNIDLSLKPLYPKLQIALPNGTVIGNLKEARNINHDLLLSKVNELSFSVPYFIETLSELAPNPNIKKLKERYLIKLKLGYLEEIYMINHTEDKGDDTTLEKSVHCYSLPWELNNRIIQAYEDNVNAKDALEQALLPTNFNVGYIDSDFLIKTRAFEINDNTVLNFVFQIAETYNAIVTFDTVNRLVNLYKEESVGHDKGLRLSYGKYLQSIGKESDADEMTTHLNCYGSDGISIQTVNPTGSSFIENFSFFMYPFERDINKNVIQHSEYMSDGLCHAILDYQALVETKKEDFTKSLENLQSYQSALLTKQGELEILKGELQQIQDSIDINKGMGNDLTELNTKLATKNAEIATKESEIQTVNSSISIIETHINDLKSQLSLENNFTPEQIEERNYFIIEKTWTDDNIIDPLDLYNEAIKQFESMRKPKVTFSIDIVNFLNIVEEQRNWDKLSLGDTVTIRYEMLDVYVAAKITEIHYDYESNNITLTISDTFDAKDAKNSVLDKLTQAYSTSTALDGLKGKWNDSSDKVGEIDKILNDTWDAVKREISAGVNNSISISGKGIVITNPQNPNEMVLLQSGVVAVSNSGGNDWRHAITPNGIIGEQIIGRLIAGVNLVIENESGKFTLDKDGAVFNLDSFKIISDGKDLSKEWMTNAQYEFNNEQFKSTFYKSNGNILKNSVGFAGKDLWTVTGVVNTINGETNTDLIIYGAGSGFEFKGGTLKQEVSVQSDTTFTLSSIVKKDVSGTGYIKIYEQTDTISNEAIINIEAKSYNYEIVSIQFKPVTNKVTVELYGDSESNLILTSNMLNLGDTAKPWQASNGEVYNTSITMDINGIKVAQVDEEGTPVGYTIMSPKKFAGYNYIDSNNDGKIDDQDNAEEVFSMDKDEFKMKKANVTEEITMNPIKIVRVPLDDEKFRGWGFVAMS